MPVNLTPSLLLPIYPFSHSGSSLPSSYTGGRLDSPHLSVRSTGFGELGGRLVIWMESPYRVGTGEERQACNYIWELPGSLGTKGNQPIMYTHCLPESHSAIHPVGALVYSRGLTYERLLGSDEDLRGRITAETEVHPTSVAPTGSQGRLGMLTEDHSPWGYNAEVQKIVS